MRANVYIRKHKTKQSETRYTLIVREYGHREKYIHLGPISKKLAEERRLQVLHELMVGTFKREPLVFLYFSELIEKFFKDFANNSRSPGTLRIYHESLVAPLKYFKGYRLNQIKRHDLDKFFAGREVSGRTKNITLSVLRLVFKKAVEWNYLSASPTDGVKRFAESGKGSRALTPNELISLLKNTTAWQRSIIRVMVFSGMRPGELSNLKFQDIDWEQNRLAIVSDKDRKTKNGKSRYIPLHEELKEELLFLKNSLPMMGGFTPQDYKLRQSHQKEYVFCHEDGQRVQCFRKAVHEAMRNNQIEGVTPHGLRKTFCSQLARYKVHPKVAQQLMGHSDISLTMQVYTEIDDEQLREGINALPSLRVLPKVLPEKRPPQLKLIYGNI